MIVLDTMQILSIGNAYGDMMLVYRFKKQKGRQTFMLLYFLLWNDLTRNLVVSVNVTYLHT